MVEIRIAGKLFVLFWFKLLFNVYRNSLNTELQFKNIMNSVLIHWERDDKN